MIPLFASQSFDFSTKINAADDETAILSAPHFT
jgi:hypothetical protein